MTLVVFVAIFLGVEYASARWPQAGWVFVVLWAITAIMEIADHHYAYAATNTELAIVAGVSAVYGVWVFGTVKSRRSPTINERKMADADMVTVTVVLRPDEYTAIIGAACGDNTTDFGLYAAAFARFTDACWKM